MILERIIYLLITEKFISCNSARQLVTTNKCVSVSWTVTSRVAITLCIVAQRSTINNYTNYCIERVLVPAVLYADKYREKGRHTK